MDSYSFENLEVWKVSRKFVVEVYKIQSLFPPFEKYGLGDQLRRAVISIPSNIAEGNSRTSLKEQIHFIEIFISSSHPHLHYLETLEHLLSTINIHVIGGRSIGGKVKCGVFSFYLFGKELRNDLIPYMEEHYSVYTDRDYAGGIVGYTEGKLIVDGVNGSADAYCNVS